MVFDKKEALRYLGYKGTEPDAQMNELIDRSGEELLSVITPRSTWAECRLLFPEKYLEANACSVFSGETPVQKKPSERKSVENETKFNDTNLHKPVIQIEDMIIKSNHLYKNLKGCEKAVLFAATLGSEVDRLIAKKTVVRMSEAVIYQAAAAAIIETYCDEVNEEIGTYYAREGFFLRPRFSPGYGDVALAHQRDFCRLLNTSKKIGMTLTEGDLLVPIKSVTAVIGLSKQNTDCHKKGCEECDKTDCEFRRQGRLS